MKVRASRVLLAVACASLLGASGCTPVNACNPDGSCPMPNQLCDEAVGFCTERPGPEVQIKLPTSDTLITENVVTVSGSVVDVVGDGIQRVEVRAAGGEWRPVDALSAQGDFTAALPLPPTNNLAVNIEARAIDVALGEGNDATTPTVDNVAPEAVIEPADGSLITARSASIRFSEPIDWFAASGGTITISPDATRAPNAAPPTELRFQSLQPDTTYTITVPVESIGDKAGHRNLVEVTSTFRTAPAVPANGLLTGTAGLPELVDDFEVASDGQGHVAIAAWKVSGSLADLYLIRFHPKTGAGEFINRVQGLSSATREVRLTAGMDLDPTAEDGITEFLPVIGASWKRGTAYETLLKKGEAAATVYSGPAMIVPYGSSFLEENSAEPGELLFDGSTWSLDRAGAVLATGWLPPQQFIAAGRHDWEFLYLDGSTLTRRQRRCDPEVGCANTTLTLDAAPTPEAALSAAIAPNGARLYIFEETAGRSALCATDHAATPVPIGIESGTYVTSGGVGGRFIAARMSSGGIEVLQREVGASCSTSVWESLGTAPPESANATKWRPALFGNKPGVLYSAGSELYVYIP